MQLTGYSVGRKKMLCALSALWLLNLATHKLLNK